MVTRWTAAKEAARGTWGVVLVAIALFSLWLASTPAPTEPESAKAAFAAVRDTPQLDPVNHMAAPLIAWGAGRLLGAPTGTSARVVYRRLRIAGALLMALVVVMGGLAAQAVRPAAGVGPIAALALGTTWVVTAHAMNPWETTWAFPFLSLALLAAVIALRTGRGRRWAGLAGAALSVGSCVYLSTLFALPGVAWLVTSGRAPRQRARAMALFAAAVCIATYAGLAVGTWPQFHSVLGPIREYRELGAHGLFGAPGVAAVGGILFGWTNSLVPLPEWGGARAWLQSGPYLGVAVRVTLALVALVALARSVRLGGAAPEQRDVAIACGLVAVGGFLVPWLWAATTYLKLWTVCIAALPLAIGVAGTRIGTRRWIAAGALAMGMAVLFTKTLPDARQADVNGPAADALVRRHPDALFVTIGWGNFDTELAMAGPAAQVTVIDLALRDNAAPGMRDAVARAGLDSAMRAGCAAGRGVYLVEFVNMDSTRWTSFYERRVGLTFGLVRWLTAGTVQDTTLTLRDADHPARHVDVVRRRCES